MDLLPTCIDLAGVEYPQEHAGKATIPLAGASLAPALGGGSLGERELYFEHEGNAAVRIGNWKIVRANRKPWELYDLQADRTELHDLAKQQPARLATMKAKWQAWADAVGVEPWPSKRKRN